jgi:2-polyprenyl-6-methoxyphenol hydroxylase-like FAD-dependent oxidoreductase
MRPSRETDALVVGGGPVGLFAALSLAERGVRVEVVEKDWAGSAHSYALALHPSSLELLDGAGLAAEVIEQGKRIEKIGIYDARQRLGELDLSRLGGRFPFVLVLPQSGLERALEQQLRKHKVPLLWNHEILGLTQNPEGVDCEIGRVEKVPLGYPIARTEWVINKRFHSRAAFVIGADGYHSFTRKALGARYEDLGGAQMFSVFEFDAGGDLGDEVRLVFHEDTTNVLWPMRDGRGRFSFQVDSTDRPLDADSLRELIGLRATWFTAEPGEIGWRTHTHFERRLAARFGSGRIWLAGDAGHITGPAGVQSMNVGLREARDLAERIAGVVREGAPVGTLEAYHTEREAEWSMLLLSGAQVAAGPEAPDWARDNAARLLPCLPASGDQLTTLLAQAGLQLI